MLIAGISINMGFDWLCHRRADRSFFWGDKQFPICARCTGVILGEIFSIIIFILGFRPGYLYSLILLIPLGADWGFQFLKVLESENWRRLFTGVLGGAGLTFIDLETFFLIAKLLHIL